jgi:hypothetical protein
MKIVFLQKLEVSLAAEKLSSFQENLYTTVVSQLGKGKCNVIPVLLAEHHAMKAMKACWGSGGIAHRSLDLGIRWR